MDAAGLAVADAFHGRFGGFAVHNYPNAYLSALAVTRFASATSAPCDGKCVLSCSRLPMPSVGFDLND